MTLGTRPLSALRPHAENVRIFGDPEDSREYASIKDSIRRFGIIDPLAILADGTIISGHLRYIVAKELKLSTVPVRLLPPYANYRAEVEALIRFNTDRRHLTPQQIGLASKRLRDLPKAEGGAKKPHGGDRRSDVAKQNQGGASATLKTRDEAAAILGVGSHEARALEKVFTTPGVPKELQDAVNNRSVAPTPAAKAISTELRRQGGTITDPDALKAMAMPKQRAVQPAPTSPHEEHARRVEAQALAFERDYRDLFELYKRTEDILRRRPLTSVIGPTEHHKYRRLIHSYSMLCWRQIEAVEGPTDTGRQMSLTVVDGGKS